MKDLVDRVDRRRPRQRRRSVVQHRVHRRHHRVAGERRFAGEHLVEQRARREQIRACIDGLGQELLRRHVGRCAHDLARQRQILHRRLVVAHDGARQPEVEQLDTETGEEDIGWLEVPLHDLSLVQRLEGTEHREHHRQRLRHRNRSLLEPRRERPSLEQLHREIELPVGFGDVEELADVGMVDRGRCACLPPEAVAGRRVTPAVEDRLMATGRSSRSSSAA